MGARGVIILVSTLVLMGLALFMFDLPRPASDDMAPSIRKGDLLFACRVCGAPSRGDVVLFTPPGETGLIVRRVMALPGDTVAVKSGVIHVNGAPLPRTPDNDGGGLETNGAHQYRVLNGDGAGSRPPVKLDDQYFLAADRRSAKDSRDYGPVAHAAVRSTVLRILRFGDSDGKRSKHIP